MTEEERSPKTSPTFPKLPGQGQMSFGNCLMLLANSPTKARREEWPDDGTHIRIQDEKLMIWLPSDKRLHPLIVSVGDILSKDWVTVHDKPKEESN